MTHIRPKELDWLTMPDTKEVPCGWEWTTIPELTENNFLILIDEYNKLIRIVEEMADKLNIELEEE